MSDLQKCCKNWYKKALYTLYWDSLSVNILSYFNLSQCVQIYSEKFKYIAEMMPL